MSSGRANTRGVGRMVAIAVAVLSGLVAAPSLAASPIGAVKPGVLRVVVAPAQGEGPGASGTAFKVGPGLYVTNRHVIALASHEGYQVWLVPSTPGARPEPAEVRAQTAKDLALLHADDIPGPALRFAAGAPEAGSGVVALGYPGEMDAVLGRSKLSEAAQPDVTVGALINSAVAHREDVGDVFELVHSASLWPGNSGGPLLDKCGRVLGVNTWVHTSQEFAQQNIAIAARDVQAFLEANSVTSQVDGRVCNEGVLAGGEAPGPAAPHSQVSPALHGRGEGGLDGFVLLLMAGLGGCAFAGGAIYWANQRQRKRVEASSKSAPW